MLQSGRVVFSRMEEVLFGIPAAQAIAEQAKDAQRVFLMVSGTLRRETDEVEKVRRTLGNRCAGVFDRMPPHTPRNAVIAAAESAREARADLIVTIGGGSITDGAKAVQLCLTNDIRTPEALDALRPVNGAPPPCNAPSVRQVTVPTTLSAGEFSAIAGVTDERHKVKELFRHPRIIPRAVILDPAITVHTPEWLFLSTGIRAVDHAVEDICSPECQPISEGASYHALKLLGRGLSGVKADPLDLDARLDCQLGAWMSMVGSQTGVPKGASHGIGHVLGGTAHVPHGYTSCVMLPHVLRFNAPVNAGRQALVSEAMGRPGEPAGDVVAALIAGLGLPGRLRDVGVQPEQLDRIALLSMHDRWIHTNPRKIDGPPVIRELLDAAW
jgi:maleylacetate reductase